MYDRFIIFFFYVKLFWNLDSAGKITLGLRHHGYVMMHHNQYNFEFKSNRNSLISGYFAKISFDSLFNNWFLAPEKTFVAIWKLSDSVCTEFGKNIQSGARELSLRRPFRKFTPRGPSYRTRFQQSIYSCHSQSSY